MHLYIELAVTLAVFEGLLFALFFAAQRRVSKLKSATDINLMDDGPWWSVWFHRVWLVCHLPVIAFQSLCSWIVRRPVAFHPAILHIGNFALLLLGVGISG